MHLSQFWYVEHPFLEVCHDPIDNIQTSQLSRNFRPNQFLRSILIETLFLRFNNEIVETELPYYAIQY